MNWLRFFFRKHATLRRFAFVLVVAVFFGSLTEVQAATIASTGWFFQATDSISTIVELDGVGQVQGPYSTLNQNAQGIGSTASFSATAGQLGLPDPAGLLRLNGSLQTAFVSNPPYPVTSNGGTLSVGADWTDTLSFSSSSRISLPVSSPIIYERFTYKVNGSLSANGGGGRPVDTNSNFSITVSGSSSEGSAGTLAQASNYGLFSGFDTPPNGTNAHGDLVGELVHVDVPVMFLPNLSSMFTPESVTWTVNTGIQLNTFVTPGTSASAMADFKDTIGLESVMFVEENGDTITPESLGYTANFGSGMPSPNLAGQTPEPSTLTLLGIGIAGMAGYGWRRRKAATA